MDSHRFLNEVDRLHAAATEALAAACAGRSLCSLSRDGAAPPRAKELEGRVAALAEVRRAVRAPGANDLSAVPAELVENWGRLARQHEDRPSSAWAAYARGGVAALDELGAILPS